MVVGGVAPRGAEGRSSITSSDPLALTSVAGSCSTATSPKAFCCRAPEAHRRPALLLPWRSSQIDPPLKPSEELVRRMWHPSCAASPWGGSTGQAPAGAAAPLVRLGQEDGGELTECTAAHLWLRVGPSYAQVRRGGTLPCSTNLRAPARSSEVGMLQADVFKCFTYH
jgi:hypothetical protein